MACSSQASASWKKPGAAASAAPYVNVLAVKEGNEDNEAIQALVRALQSDEVKAFMEETFGSAVVPAF